MTTLSKTYEYRSAYNRSVYASNKGGPVKKYQHATQAEVTPTLRQLEWAAGFIEGEGSFDSDRGRGRIAVNQVNREPLEKLLSFFGGHIYSRMPTEGIGKQRINTWITTGPRARGIMMTIYSLLTERRKQQVKVALSIH